MTYNSTDRTFTWTCEWKNNWYDVECTANFGLPFDADQVALWVKASELQNYNNEEEVSELTDIGWNNNHLEWAYADDWSKPVYNSWKNSILWWKPTVYFDWKTSKNYFTNDDLAEIAEKSHLLFIAFHPLNSGQEKYMAVLGFHGNDWTNKEVYFVKKDNGTIYHYDSNSEYTSNENFLDKNVILNVLLSNKAIAKITEVASKKVISITNWEIKSFNDDLPTDVSKFTVWGEFDKKNGSISEIWNLFNGHIAEIILIGDTTNEMDLNDDKIIEKAKEVRKYLKATY